MPSFDNLIISPNDPILITGASGYMGPGLVRCLLDHGFRKLRCFTRPGSDLTHLQEISREKNGARIEIIRGNLLSREDCLEATQGVAVVFHLATGGGGKSFPDVFMNTVVTTRNLLAACVEHRCLKRFVNLSSLAVYTNREKPTGTLLDETCALDDRPELRGDAYCFAKVRQDELVMEYGRQFDLPYVIVRPGYVLGPGKTSIVSRVGIDTFGLFLHLGGSNPIPFTYIDNCNEAIVLAGLTKGVDGEVFNVMDDDLPSSRQFLKLYKRQVRKFRSIYLPHFASYALCSLWEKYSHWSAGQLPLSFNRRHWHAYWKKTRYTNQKLKTRLGWKPSISMSEGCERYFAACREECAHA